MPKLILRVHGVSTKDEIDGVEKVEEHEGFLVFKDSKENEVGRARSSAVDLYWIARTEKPALADRTPQELGSLKELVTKAESLGFRVELIDAKDPDGTVAT